jgi:alkanesulfonate monooxygenase SsuD/methylene tetrahydromethanopterin reductase-like flavin-dependent oxidoreductase (luciferase family)
MAALSPESFVEAGRRGFNLLCAPVFGFGGRSGVENLELYRQSLREHGHDPRQKEIAALIMVYAAPSAEEAARDFAEPVIWYYRTFAKYIAPPPGEAPIKTYEPYAGVRDMAAQVTWEQLQMAGAVVCGTPDDCAERLAQMQQMFGFTTVLCWTRLGGLDHRKVLRCMELMEQSVIPKLRPIGPSA